MTSPVNSAPGARLPRPGDRASKPATTTTSAGLANSPGCSTKPPIGSQRRAPLVSDPISRVRTSMARESASNPIASRKTPLGDSNEAPNSNRAAGIKNST